MCGRYTLTQRQEKIAEELTLPLPLPEWPARYNVAPTQTVPAVRLVEGERRLQELRWGLVPAWADDEKAGFRMINARAETVFEKPSFRRLAVRQRCLIPADGFYEWKKAGAKVRLPFRFVLKSRGVLAFAGIWDRWCREGRTIESFCILTTEANSLVQPVHDRMPVILRPEEYALWLDSDIGDPERLRPLLRPYSSERMDRYAVGARVNSPHVDDPGCIEPLQEPPAQAVRITP